MQSALNTSRGQQQITASLTPQIIKKAKAGKSGVTVHKRDNGEKENEAQGIQNIKDFGAEDGKTERKRENLGRGRDLLKSVSSEVGKLKGRL